MVSLKYLNLSDEHVWAACGFGGGLGKKDLCGFLTGGIMRLGFSSTGKKEERAGVKKICSQAVDQFLFQSFSFQKTIPALTRRSI